MVIGWLTPLLSVIQDLTFKILAQTTAHKTDCFCAEQL
jgi:hypothetical protein